MAELELEGDGDGVVIEPGAWGTDGWVQASRVRSTVPPDSPCPAARRSSCQRRTNLLTEAARMFESVGGPEQEPLQDLVLGAPVRQVAPEQRHPVDPDLAHDPDPLEPLDRLARDEPG